MSQPSFVPVWGQLIDKEQEDGHTQLKSVSCVSELRSEPDTRAHTHMTQASALFFCFFDDTSDRHDNTLKGPTWEFRRSQPDGPTGSDR